MRDTVRSAVTERCGAVGGRGVERSAVAVRSGLQSRNGAVRPAVAVAAAVENVVGITVVAVVAVAVVVVVAVAVQVVVAVDGLRKSRRSAVRSAVLAVAPQFGRSKSSGLPPHLPAAVAARSVCPAASLASLVQVAAGRDGGATAARPVDSQKMSPTALTRRVRRTVLGLLLSHGEHDARNPRRTLRVA